MGPEAWDPWLAARRVIAALGAAGWEAVFVGGCVRDLLLGRASRDVDVATAAPPEAVMDVFPQAVPTGLAFGTVTVPMGGVPVEVTTYRREGGYRDRRRPSKVVFTARVEEDLARRDFTVNAMALTPSGRLIDPFGGLHDLLAGRIAAVGEPKRRFAEDALRMVRALRLAAELSFDLDPAVARALREQMDEVRHVAAERVFAEWRLLVAGRVKAVASELAVSGFLAWWIPLPKEWDAGNLVPAVARWADICTRLPPSPAMRTAALLRVLGCSREHVGSIGERWRASRAFEREVSAWWEAAAFDPLGANPGEWARWLYHTGRSRSGDGFRLTVALRGYTGEQESACRASFRRALNSQPVWERRDWAVGLEALCREAGVPPGPVWGDLERELTEAMLEGRVANEPHALRRFVRKWARVHGDREGPT
ncbi:MAG: hypothetical protein QJR01_00855 [Kyrpidia sp.]|nr:hypothetical protein [Kyrpidia sp.]